MTNTLVTPTWVVNQTALRFINSVKGIANFNRSYDDAYVQSGAKVGYTVQARLPQRFTVSDGQAYDAQNLYDQTVPISLTNQKHVDFDWSSAQGTMEIDRVKERYTDPAADALASAADLFGMQAVYKAVWNLIGTPGTTPSTTLQYLQAGVKLTDGSAPVSGRVAVLDQMHMATIANTASSLFNPAAVISEAYRDGMFGRKQLGIDEWYFDQNMPSHTTGTFTSSTPVVNGASQTGSSIVTSGWAAGASSLKAGDVLTFAGVNSVNPVSFKNTGRLQQFTVTQDVSDSGGAMTIPISPSIITSGQLQTVSGSPANSAAINVYSGTGTYAQSATTYPTSLIFHPDFAAFVMADLVEPAAGAKSSNARSRDYGINIRFCQFWDYKTDRNGNRMDILIGAAPLQPRLACRMIG